jgi:hypothetical protein
LAAEARQPAGLGEREAVWQWSPIACARVSIFIGREREREREREIDRKTEKKGK